MVYNMDSISHWICKLSSVKELDTEFFVKSECLMYVARIWKYCKGFNDDKARFKFYRSILRGYYEKHNFFLTTYPGNEENGEVHGIIVPFEDAQYLVGTHSVSLSKGFVQIPNALILNVIKSIR